MKKTLLSLLFISFVSVLAAQQKFDRFSIGAAFDYSVINNRKEIRGQYKPGVNFRLMYYTRPWFAVEGEYTYHFKHVSSPGLADIRSWNADINGNFITQIGESDLFFHAIFGAGFMNWSGVFVGPKLNDNKTYTIGYRIPEQHITFNVGCGVSHSIRKHGVGFGEFRLRMASEGRRQSDLFSVIDSSINLGVRLGFGQTKSDGDRTETIDKKSRHHRPSRIYKWLHD